MSIFKKQKVKKVYLIESFINGTYQYKIGVSQDPRNRLKQHRISNPNVTEIVAEFESNYPYKIESALKNRFSTKKLNGEWFDLSMEEIEGFEKFCETTEQNIDFLNRNAI
jgi:hypothetical protein